jgi:hypothetical protein
MNHMLEDVTLFADFVSGQNPAASDDKGRNSRFTWNFGVKLTVDQAALR